MGLITYIYKKKLVCRYDKQAGIPYYSYSDFPGLYFEEHTFENKRGIEIHYFYYNYENCKTDKIILFCHGIGPGHTAYLKEIEWLARAGYKILAFDYGGCGQSSGKSLGSLWNPTYDALDLLDHLKIDKEIIVVGHSLGGFTSLNVLALRDEIHKGVVISGFLSVPLLMKNIVENKFVFNSIKKYESKFEITKDNNLVINFLNQTSKNILFIHSEDDNVVPYNSSLKIVESINNPHIKTLRVTNKKHNPNYTEEAVKYMEMIFREYSFKLKNKEIKTSDEKIRFFSNVSLDKMTEQDPNIIRSVLSFIDSNF